MEYKKLGFDGPRVSRICLGSMTWGQQNTLQEAHQQIDCALDYGVNFIDTAEMYAVPPKPETYGKTEEIIGQWFLKTKKRHQVILATKIAGPNPALGHIRGGKGLLNRKDITEALDASLKRLKTDFIDLYQIHWPARDTNFFGQREFTGSAEQEFFDKNQKIKDQIEESLTALNDFIKQGKVGQIGVSNETPWGISHYLAGALKKNCPKIVSIQNPYNLLNRLFEIGLSEFSLREDVGLLAYSPLAFGVLTGKYFQKRDQKARLDLFPHYDRYQNEQAQKATKLYFELANKKGLQPAQMALAYLLTKPFVTSIIIGATCLDQLKQNIESINLKLTEDILNEIKSIHQLCPNPAP